ncbi:hypothetical protein FRB95_014632 [Tulasnella sp. JGI-2019a]|nr:hypothetical protein FRB95_014632 [Tulasnella sp. JGI-2019a]
MVPKLESLTLASIALRSWDSTILPHLRALALYRVCILPQELMLALRECRTLVRLSMDQLTLSDGTAPLSLPKDPQPILLNSLINLCIKDIPSDMIIALLAVLETPSCTSFLLGSIYRRFDDTYSPSCIDYITLAARRAFASPAHIEFVYDRLGPNLRVQGDDWTWQFKLLEPTLSKLINWVLFTFKDVLNHTSTEITFDSLEDRHNLLIYEQCIINPLLRIETIRIGPTISIKMLAILISALSQSQSGGEWEGQWLCPHLRHLHIARDTGARALMRMLRNRRNSRGAVNVLETLELSHESTWSRKTFRKIECIVGPHVLRRSKAKEVEISGDSPGWVEYWALVFKVAWSMHGMCEGSLE